MNHKLVVHNSLVGQKQEFEPIHEGKVGMYVCGPTVYNDVHLGNCRTFISFDIIYRYLKYLGYKVRYVRNITDVGHLTDLGEDKVSKGAKLEQLEPMEIVQKYSNGFHQMMEIFNTEKPSIEPRATGHIIEQIEMVQTIMENGYAYEKNGSVYFDTIRFNEDTNSYGKLSGRILEDLLVETRDDLKNQSEKKHPSDFAIWMKADESHLMKWNSPWSLGFPGWHLECSAMSTKYLGKTFDIHGGGNDLKFPHHENEIAQNRGACKCEPAKYWLHSNMLLLNGKKMSKSDGNTISPEQLFSGESEFISKGYSPMVVKFFMLQSHYRSTLDLTDMALSAAEKGYKRLMEAHRLLDEMTASKDMVDDQLESKINKLIDAVHQDMCDDFNTPKAIARLFELVPIINSYKNNIGNARQIGLETLERLKKTFNDYIVDIFGLTNEYHQVGEDDSDRIDGLMSLILDIRQEARTNKNWPIADKIRDTLTELNITVKDGKEGTSWSV